MGMMCSRIWGIEDRDGSVSTDFTSVMETWKNFEELINEENVRE